MKILHMFSLFSLPHGGGTVDFIYWLSGALAERGHEVVIYTSDYELDQEYIDSLPKVKVYCFKRWLNFTKLYFTPGLITQVSKQLKDFDVVHLHCFRSFQNIVIHHYAQKYGVPYLLDAHGSLLSHGNMSLIGVLRWLFDVTFGRRMLRDSHKVIAENQVAVEEYKKFGSTEEKVVLIPLSFPVDEFSELPPPGIFRSRYNVSEKHIVMSLGRINWIKGLDFLVESFYNLTRLRDDVILVMVGQDDGYKAILEELIGNLCLSNRVLFTGFLTGEEKLSALVDADIVVQPSRYEQAAWAPFEAVMCGTPIIVSKHTGSGEDVSRLDAGYLVEHGNKEELAETMQNILNDPSGAGDKTRKARGYIRANLSLTKRIGDYERLYMECIKENEQFRKNR